MTSQNIDTLTVSELKALVNELYWSHFGVLSPAAIRHEIRLWQGAADVLVIDIRKMHTLNEVLGYGRANEIVGELIRCRESRNSRPADFVLIGQYGGDEFVILAMPGDGEGMLKRFLEKADALTEQLTAEERAAIAAHTGGLVDGICIAAVLAPNVPEPMEVLGYVVDATNKLKEGRNTGNRNTSGAQGTCIDRWYGLALAA